MAGKALEMEQICIAFSGVQVLKNINFSLDIGEVCGLVGKNGAGKSTMLKILLGLYHASSGEVELFGENVKENNGRSFDQVGMIFQELSLIPEMSVLDNMFLKNEKVRNGLIQGHDEEELALSFMKRYGIDINIHEKIKNLSSSDKQMVEICKAVLKGKKLLLMDEPTAAMDDVNAAKLYRIVKQLKEEGTTIILITHHLQEIMDNCDSVAVLRDGEMVLNDKTRNLMMTDMIAAMLGDEQKDYSFVRSIVSIDHQTPILELKDVVTDQIKEPLSFKIYPGEVLGLAGLKGSGRTEVFRAIYGLDRLRGGSIFIQGKQLKIRGTEDAVKAGIFLIPESRRFQGLSVEHTIKFNINTPILDTLTKGPLIAEGEANRITDDYIKRMNIKAIDRNDKVKTLSGGNQQKVVISKALATNPKILLMDDPTYGVDVGAKAEIMKIIDLFKQQGGTVIMASSEIEEVTQNCNRILVLKRRRLTGELSNEDYQSITQEDLAAAIQ